MSDRPNNAPWTPEQVAALNARQANNGPLGVHPYTCGAPKCRAILVATESGWICPQPFCGYRQNWAMMPSEEEIAAVTALSTGGPAFPCSQHTGLTMRDWFAGQALIGLLAFPGEESSQLDIQTAAQEAYEQADAMMAERAKKTPK